MRLYDFGLEDFLTGGGFHRPVDGGTARGYSESMKDDHRRSVPWVAGCVLLITVLCLPPAGSANDYYSWIDANGTMVMTDDPSRVPPPTSRSEIQVHRFEPPVPGDPGRPEEEPASASREEPTPPRPEAVDPRDLNLPLVVLGEPDQPVGGQYVWVPLLSPLFVGGNAVRGFWWHPGATSPVEAFKHFLARHNREQRTQWAPGVGVPYPHSPNSQTARGGSGNTVYDQVVRERQALEESIRLRHFPASPAPVPGSPARVRGAAPRGGGHHSIRAR